ncbi:hypothetical protein CXF80_11055 [Shewanella sp. Actino-trap-3]|jgi:hypothetical protein|nr:hypothetical protein CXF80_11055 [Shewanella sp. Actino-trap-3]|tara:strand:- start:41368 stop:41571 length:204 start_codon:yes stop_codon:yes gene_type:complete
MDAAINTSSENERYAQDPGAVLSVIQPKIDSSSTTYYYYYYSYNFCHKVAFLVAAYVTNNLVFLAEV